MPPKRPAALAVSAEVEMWLRLPDLNKQTQSNSRRWRVAKVGSVCLFSNGLRILTETMGPLPDANTALEKKLVHDDTLHQQELNRVSTWCVPQITVSKTAFATNYCKAWESCYLMTTKLGKTSVYWKVENEKRWHGWDIKFLTGNK